MPRIKQNKYDYLVRDKVKDLHGRLLAEGIRDAEVGRWLNCSGQNVGAHFRNASFSYRQILIIEGHLTDHIKTKQNKHDRNIDKEEVSS